MSRADARLVEPNGPRRTVKLALPKLTVEIDVDRGGQITYVGRPGGATCSSMPTPLPATVTAGYGSDALDWLSHYRGGWQVMFPNAGASSVVDGVPLPLHGEVSSARQTVREIRPDPVLLESATRRPLRLERRFSIDADRPALRIEGRAINDADWPMVVAWGQQPAFVAPTGTHIDLPPGPVHADAGLDGADVDVEPGVTGSCPLVGSRNGSQVDLSVVPDGPIERVVYLPDRTQAWAALRNAETGRGVALACDGERGRICGFGNNWVAGASHSSIEFGSSRSSRSTRGRLTASGLPSNAARDERWTGLERRRPGSR